MPTLDFSQLSLDDLVKKLEEAIAHRDKDLATEIKRIILQRLASEAADLEAKERSLKDKEHTLLALIAEFEQQPEVEPPRAKHFDVYGVLGPGSSEAVVYPVWFGTNRKPTDDGRAFTGERHNAISYGRVEILVPKSHKIGETGSSWWKRLKRFELRDNHLRVQRVVQLDAQEMFEDLNRAMRDARDNGDSPHALVFLHGYSVTFESAAIRAAQLGVDLKVTGATAFFSWPSRGNLLFYTPDEATIEASERAISEFLVDFTARSGADKVHLIAHSMGNRGLLRALQRIAANAETRGKVRFGQIFLAAPDLDSDLFRDLAHLYREHSERTTLYASNGDRAVDLSAKKHQAPRAGYFEPYTLAPGIDTVCVPDFDIDFWGHAYFAQAKNLLSDIYELVRSTGAQVDAGKRQYIESKRDATGIWQVRM